MTCSLSWSLPEISLGQELKVQAKIPIASPQAISLDKRGQFFLSNEKGEINQYNPQGEILRTFSPQRRRELNLIEAWPTLRIFIFYEAFQEFLILDRFLNPLSGPESYQFNPEFIGFAKMATLAADNNIWVFDNTDFGLKKYDPIQGLLLSNTSLDLLLDPRSIEINFMREYQNLLIINDKNSGVLIFDNFGNYLKTLPYTDLNYIGVQQDEICFLQENQLVFYDLYKSTERKVLLPDKQAWLFATAWGENIAALSKDTLFILSPQ